MAISPDQIRAARALLDWSQEDLEKKAKIAKKTIADFERGTQIPYPRTIDDLREALEAGGVCFIPENGGGAGVRRRQAVPRLSKRRISRFDHVATFTMSYRNQEFRVRLSTDILDDMDRANHETEAAFERSFDARINKILLRAAIAVDDGRANEQGELMLVSEDFPEVAR